MATKKTPWIKHLDAYRKANPTVPYRKAITEASKTYKQPKRRAVKKPDKKPTAIPQNRRFKRGVTSH